MINPLDFPLLAHRKTVIAKAGPTGIAAVLAPDGRIRQAKISRLRNSLKQLGAYLPED